MPSAAKWFDKNVFAIIVELTLIVQGRVERGELGVVYSVGHVIPSFTGPIQGSLGGCQHRKKNRDANVSLRSGGIKASFLSL